MENHHNHIERERYPKVIQGYESDMKKSFNRAMNKSVANITKKMVDIKKKNK